MSQPYITMMKGPAPNIDVSHLPNHGFVVKVVVADSEEFEIVDNLGSLQKDSPPDNHWKIRVVGHEGVQTSKTAMFSGEVFPLNIERDLVQLKVHGDAVRGPTSLDFHVTTYKSALL